jgi:hypothetical protein
MSIGSGGFTPPIPVNYGQTGRVGVVGTATFPLEAAKSYLIEVRLKSGSVTKIFRQYAVIRDQIVIIKLYDGELVTQSVYVAGYYYNDRDNGYSLPCYWKDGVKTDLPIPAGAGFNPHDGVEWGSPGSGNYSAWATSVNYAKAITVSGGTVYAAGQWYDDNTGITTGSYWVNGARTDLSYAPYHSSAYDITVSGGTVYVAGEYDQNACYWVNGVKHDLDLNGSAGASRAESIVVSGGTVYAAGWYHDGTNEKACCWVNGTRTDLPAPLLPAANKSYAANIALVGNDVYVAGYYGYIHQPYTTPYQHYRAYYWKNGTEYNLPDVLNTESPNAPDMAVSEGNVYILPVTLPNYHDATHQYSSNYWKNGEKLTTAEFTSGITRPDVVAITVSDGRVYVAGSSNPTVWTSTAFYWRDDGAIIKLPGFPGRAYDIIVAESR